VSKEKFPGGGEGATEKNTENSKKGTGVGGEQRKKDRKIAKKHQKIALLSLYLLNLYHV